MQHKIVAEWTRSTSEVIRVHLDEWRGRPLISCRIWVRAEGDRLIPTSKGITLAVSHLRPMAEALNKAVVHAIDQGLIK
jgi:hypothetical protein